MFKRQFYLKKILKYLDNTSLIKVLVWQRRVWKSYMMRQIIDFLKNEKQIEDKNILYINLEIDFVVEKWNNRKYIQVAYIISDENVLNREFGNLLKINDNYEKIVLSLDDILIKDYKWIKHYNIWEYLVNEN